MAAEKYGPDYKMDVFILSTDDLIDIAHALNSARFERHTVRVGVDGGVKFDFGDGAGWTLPFGTDSTGRS